MRELVLNLAFWKFTIVIRKARINTQVEFRRAELKGQDIFCHFWFAAEELGEVVN